MALKSAWRKAVSAFPICVALSIPAGLCFAEEPTLVPRSSRRSVPTESAPRPTEVKLNGISTDVPESDIERPVFKPTPATRTTEGDIELIQERYPTGAIKIEREMTQDAEGNYIRHGNWTLYDTAGNIIARGRYEKGEREGTWTRVYKGDESPIFAQSPYREYKGPYLSQANFENGRLSGAWIIADAKQHKISEINFENGVRNGLSISWYPSGAKMQEVVYREGLIDGEHLQWSTDSKLIAKEEYQAGRKISPKITFFSNGQKKVEESYLSPAVTIDSGDDWWNAKFSIYATHGKETKHGPSTSWHENGQKRLTGNYENNQPEGKFVWWFPSGQKSMEGVFQNGKPVGVWTWWHANGQKATRGEYKDGVPVGKWMWWNEDGRLAKSVEGERLLGELSKPAAESASLQDSSISATTTLTR